MDIADIDINRILYATDLSPSARHAFAYAVSMANRYDAKLVLLNVIDDVPDMDERVIGYISSSRWEEIKRNQEDDARNVLIGKRRGRAVVAEVLDGFIGEAREKMDAASNLEGEEIVVVRGNPAEQIIAQAQENNCDLIVMGTHGVGSFGDAMMGSTARRVVRRSPIPVLVIRLPEDD